MRVYSSTLSARLPTKRRLFDAAMMSLLSVAKSKETMTLNLAGHLAACLHAHATNHLTRARSMLEPSLTLAAWSTASAAAPSSSTVPGSPADQANKLRGAWLMIAYAHRTSMKPTNGVTHRPMATDSTGHRVPPGNRLVPIVLLFQDSLKSVVHAQDTPQRILTS